MHYPQSHPYRCEAAAYRHRPLRRNRSGARRLTWRRLRVPRCACCPLPSGVGPGTLSNCSAPTPPHTAPASVVPQTPRCATASLRLLRESLEHSSDRHPAAVFKHSEPCRAHCRHDPPLTPSRPQPKPPPHNARQRNNGHPHRRTSLIAHRLSGDGRGNDNHKQHTINARYSGTSICRHPLPTSRRTPGPTIALRLAAYAPRLRRERWARLSWRHPTGTNSLRSLEPSPCGRGCLATASLIHSAPPLRYRLHTSGRRTTPTTYALTSATIQGLYNITTYRHLDTSTQAPPHTPSAARRHTTPLRLPWRSLMQGRAVIPHQSKIFNRPTIHCFTEALMAELFGWAALLRLSSPPCCPGHLRLAHCRHRHACHDITPTCFRGYVNDAAESGFAGI